MPLIAESEPELPREQIEELVGPVMEQIAGAVPDSAPALQRFAEAWDGGAVGPRDLLPAAGKEGAAAREERLGLGAHLARLPRARGAPSRARGPLQRVPRGAGRDLAPRRLPLVRRLARLR